MKFISPNSSVLCFGDSNTWGFDPKTTKRYPRAIRWPGVLQRELGDDYLIIEEGLSGRTTVLDDPNTPGRRGSDYLAPCLQSHKPLDYVILFLGLNDLKKCYSVSVDQIAAGIRMLIGMIAESAAGTDASNPRTLLLAPPPLGKLTHFAESFSGSKLKSRQLAPKLCEVASECHCEFLNTADVIAFSEIDGLHLDADGHEALGKAVSQRIRFSSSQSLK